MSKPLSTLPNPVESDANLTSALAQICARAEVRLASDSTGLGSVERGLDMGNSFGSGSEFQRTKSPLYTLKA